jgi:cytochrome c oxidase subunit II
VAVHASQFEWNATHAGPDELLGTGDDIAIRNQIHIPVNRPVVVTLTAEDVIHSFNVHAFRVKQDAVPGMTIRVWFEATEPGEYELACAELCGLGHYRMRAVVTVHTADSYARWLSEHSQTVALR